MNKGRISRSFAILLVVLLSFSTVTIFNVKAQSFMTITIEPDGSIDPVNSSIERLGNTYKFTDNIYGSLVVIRSNITINGNGYTLNGDGSSSGIDIPHKYDVAIKNLIITNHLNGIKLSAFRIIPNQIDYYGSCHRTSISNNRILNNDVGVLSDHDQDTDLYGNIIQENRIGLDLRDSHGNVFRDNQFLNNEESFLVNPSTYYDDSNTIDGIPVTKIFSGSTQ